MGSWGEGGEAAARAHAQQDTRLQPEGGCAKNRRVSTEIHRLPPAHRPQLSVPASLSVPRHLFEHIQHLEAELPTWLNHKRCCQLSPSRGRQLSLVKMQPGDKLHVRTLVLPLAICVTLTSSLTAFKPLFPY